MPDILIRSASILDGSGSPPLPGDLRISGATISQIGQALPPGDCLVINAEGLVLCPGFIDMHSHADLALLTQPAPDQKIRQGVTTELLGQDGLGVAPVTPHRLKDLQQIINGLQGQLPDSAWSWQSFAEYLERLEQAGLPNHVAVLATHAPLRLAAVGMEKRPAAPVELRAMQEMLAACMESGAFGVSSGLEYPPQYNADLPELAGLAAVAAEAGGIYVVHQRNEGMRLLESFHEQLEVARRSGVHLHISHLKAWGPGNWGLIDPVLAEAQAYIDQGGALTWDRYPYLSGSTLLGIILPHWAWSDGTEALIRSLSVPAFRDQLRGAYRLEAKAWEHDPGSIGWHNQFISGVNRDANRWMEGRNIAEIAAETGKDEVDVVCDLLASERLAVTAIFFYGNREVLHRVLAHPHACVGSDGILLGRPHPRLFGSFPRFIDEMALSGDHLTLAEAVRKLTSLPAEILGLKRRGLVRSGYLADLVLFDPAQLSAPEDYHTANPYPTGVEHVFLEGNWVVQHGRHTGELHGKVLRKND